MRQAAAATLVVLVVLILAGWITWSVVGIGDAVGGMWR